MSTPLPQTAEPGSHSSRLGRLPHWVIPAGVYLVAAVALTYPAWADPTNTTIGGGADSLRLMGYLVWFPFAITHGHNPLHLTWIDLPNGINAMWDGTMPFASLVTWPVQALFGVVAAYNALVVAALTLNGLGTYLWLRRHTRHQLAAIGGGLLMLAGPYAAARSYGHLNLILFFPLPVMFLILEDIIREPAVRPVRRGVMFGALTAIQLLCAEEPLALAGVGLVVALAVAAALNLRPALHRAAKMVPAALGAVVGFAVVGGIPLGYQFLGPSVVHGAIEAHDIWVNDLLNFVVPTSATALSLGGPGMISGPTVPWTGSPIEWNGYIGVPLLIVSLFAMARWWRNRWVLVIGITTLAMIVLSLGPHLHVNGVVHTHYPLPERIIDKLSVFENVLPNRFSLIMEFGLAATLAVFIDQVLSAHKRWHRALGAVAVALVAVTLWPSAVPATKVFTPRYFQAGGDVDKIAPETVAFVFPVAYIGTGDTAAPAMWQAVADFRFKMVSAASISATSAGLPSFDSTPEPLRCVVDSLQLTGSADACGTPPAAILDQLHSLGVKLVIMGPTAHADQISAYFTALAGAPPVRDQGVLVWSI